MTTVLLLFSLSVSEMSLAVVKRACGRRSSCSYCGEDECIDWQNYTRLMTRAKTSHTYVKKVSGINMLCVCACNV